MQSLIPSKRTTTQFALISSSVVLLTWKLMLWRARKRAKKSVDKLADMIRDDSPLIDVGDKRLRQRIIERAIRRASNWLNLSSLEKAQPMIGQVGGASIQKKPVLTLAPDYVLKPVITDHRGIREIALYEAIEAMAKSSRNFQSYSNFLRKQDEMVVANHFGEMLDTIALAFAMLLHDKFVVDSEMAMKNVWKTLRKEAELLHTLCKFVPPYYGMLGQTCYVNSVQFPFGVTTDAHLLLQDLTANFSRPCVMDLKMGTHTYEPDAPREKREREKQKFAQQVEFGFRIVGMRIYNPELAMADEEGYVAYDKGYGRNLASREQLEDAMRIYFSSGVNRRVTPPSAGNPTPEAFRVSVADNHHETLVVRGTSDRPARLRVRSISNLLVQLRAIRKWFEENKSLRFVASSLLLVYEGDPECSSTADLTTIKMIDFGRVRRSVGGDPGYLQGLRTLKDVLVGLMREESS